MSDQDRKNHAKANDDVTETGDDVEAHMREGRHATGDVADEQREGRGADEDSGDDVEAHYKGVR